MKIQELHPADRSRHFVQENESGRLGWLGHVVGKENRDVMKLLLTRNPVQPYSSLWLVVPTFAARCLHVCNDARDPSSERWNYVG